MGTNKSHHFPVTTQRGTQIVITEVDNSVWQPPGVWVQTSATTSMLKQGQATTSIEAGPSLTSKATNHE